MTSNKLRRAIAYEAARAMYFREESEYYRAKQKAASRLCKGWVKPADLPSNSEIRDEIQALARMHEGEKRKEALVKMRLSALRWMKLLDLFSPQLIGSVLTGFIRSGSDIDIHLFTDSIASVTMSLESLAVPYEVERKQIVKDGETRIFTHIHIHEQFQIELTVYASHLRSHVFKSSITGKPMERASIAQLEQILQEQHPELNVSLALEELESTPDCFQLYYGLLLPLENVKQSPKYHPEGDVLYHSLQVFDLAVNQLPYDEEFLVAALLHDIGKGIDPHDHVMAGLEALEGFITPRTGWLIKHHMEAHKIRDASIGFNAHRRLQANESYDELLLLGECDFNGRVPGIETTSLEDAIDYLRSLSKL